jgi:diadenosine tetraphosphate (Ap4A) HIT family hydrolase
VRWPDSFFAIQRGEGCQFCAESDLEDTGGGLRFLRGDVADAYLQRAAIQTGHTIVPWKLRHITEPTELASAEASAYFGDVLAAARLLERYFKPIKTNYQTLGNAVPHLHTHIILRYEDDPRPGLPFPWPDDPGLIPEDDFRATVDGLRSLARGQTRFANHS